MEIDGVRLYNQEDIVQSLDKVTNFEYKIYFNFNDIQAENAIPCLLFFYKVLTFVAKKYLQGGKPEQIRIRSNDETREWGSTVFINIYREILEALKNKNKNQTIHTVKQFQRIICGREDEESLKEYYSDTIYSQTILQICRKMDVSPEKIFASETDKCVFITIPKGETVTLGVNQIEYILNQPEHIKKKFLLTVEGTLKLKLLGLGTPECGKTTYEFNRLIESMAQTVNCLYLYLSSMHANYEIDLSHLTFINELRVYLSGTPDYMTT